MLFALVLFGSVALDDDTYTVTLAFEEMHCDECKAELEAAVKKLQGFKSIQVAGKGATATFEDKAPVPTFNRLPKDLKLVSAAVDLRGTVSASGDQATLVAKGSGATLTLVNPEKPKRVDKVGELKQQMGGANRFRVRGTLVKGKTLVLESFEKASWPDR